MNDIKDYPVTELKLIYQVLHSQIQQNFDLMDSNLLQDIQTILQSQAANDGIDVSLHSEWSLWLSQQSVS